MVSLKLVRKMETKVGVSIALAMSSCQINVWMGILPVRLSSIFTDVEVVLQDRALKVIR